jgi:hypothetical protein
MTWLLRPLNIWRVFTKVGYHPNHKHSNIQGDLTLQSEFEVMQASIDKLTEALAVKLAVEAPSPTHPAAILTPEPSGISEPVHTNDPSKDVTEPIETSHDTTETAPLPTDEPSKDATPIPIATEPTSESIDAVNKDDDEAPPTKTDSPKSPGVKKHVKRSSFFGGFFG